RANADQRSSRWRGPRPTVSPWPDTSIQRRGRVSVHSSRTAGTPSSTNPTKNRNAVPRSPDVDAPREIAPQASAPIPVAPPQSRADSREVRKTARLPATGRSPRPTWSGGPGAVQDGGSDPPAGGGPTIQAGGRTIQAGGPPTGRAGSRPTGRPSGGPDGEPGDDPGDGRGGEPGNGP